MNLGGTSAIVTGGASGLGGATAEMLAANGFQVAIFDLNDALGEAHARRIGGRYFRVDVTDDESVAGGIEAAERAQGPARILVNCAGIAISVKTVGIDAEPHPLAAFRQVIEVNLIGTFNAISKFAARLIRQEKRGEERGVIVSTSSVSAFEGVKGQAAYSASKGGVSAMTLTIARDLAEFGIRAVTVAPGPFWTPMVAAIPPELQAAVVSQMPFPSRFGKPEEFAQMVLAIIANPMLNGETIRLDGAARLGP